MLLELPQIAQAAVATYEPEPGMVDLVAYYTRKQGASDLPRSEIVQALRSRLPAYMVPAFFEELPFIPTLISNKADHKKLPKPKGPRCPAGKTLVAATSEKERILAHCLAEVLKVASVSVEDHFFNDLGANSLLMARFCARIRKNSATSNVSMRDIYLNPTIATLADSLVAPSTTISSRRVREPFHVPSDLAYYGCGALQLLFYAGYGFFALSLLASGLTWTFGAIGDPVDLYLRSVAFGVASFSS